VAIQHALEVDIKANGLEDLGTSPDTAVQFKQGGDAGRVTRYLNVTFAVFQCVDHNKIAGITGAIRKDLQIATLLMPLLAMMVNETGIIWQEYGKMVISCTPS